MDQRISAEWSGFNEFQIEFFVKRATRIATARMLPTTTTGLNTTFAQNSRGFWSFYYTDFYVDKALGAEPHRTFETTQEYFRAKIEVWSTMTLDGKIGFVSKFAPLLSQYPIQPMPQQPPGLQIREYGGPRPAVSLPRAEGETTSLKKEEDIKADLLRWASPSPSLDNDDDVRTSSRADSPASQLTDEEPSTPMRLNISSLFADCAPEELEKGVEKGVAILGRLRDTLNSQAASEESSQWLQSIESVERQAVRTRTVIGVVGNTGAGKSSIINALLDEERLLPTNCMRACTAVITEISYNYENSAYSAQIEFITARDWQLELETLFKDLLDGE